MARAQFDSILERIRNLRVAVLGDAMLDMYLRGNSRNLAVEAPVPVVNVESQNIAPGGAANAAANVAALGAQCSFFSAAGADPEGELLRDRLRDYGVNTDHLLLTGDRRTLTKRRISANSQTIIRLDSGNTDSLTQETERELCRRLQDSLRDFDALIISDYTYGILTPYLIDALARLSRSRPLIITADSKDLRRLKAVRLAAVKPNYREATQLLEIPQLSSLKERYDQISRYGQRLLHLIDTQIAAITLDRAGAMVFERSKPPYRTYSRQVQDSQAVGAGDTYIAALTLALAADAPITEAAEFAAAASHIAIAKEGTAPCYINELLQNREAYQHKHLVTRRQIEDVLSRLRQQEKQIVFTNGCFDILHRGHVTFLNQSKALGDILIVGVNTDDSIRRLKGDDRPINTLEDRINVLSALSSIDYLIPFEDDVPDTLLQFIRPDITTKGGNYTETEMPEAALVRSFGGRIEILPYIDSQSTSGLISKIRQRGGTQRL